MDTKVLENIGLTGGEVRVYLALIRLGPSTTGPITDKSKVASSKIYHLLERLLQKGLISYIIKDKTRYYQAEDPAKIRGYMKKKEAQLQEQKQAMDILIPQLQFQKQGEQEKSDAQIYKGFLGIQAIADHMYETLREGDTFYNIGIPSFQEEKYHEYWHEDHKKRVKGRIKCKMLFNKDAPKEVLDNRNKYWGCDARYLPFSIKTPSWILMYKDVSVIILQSNEPMAIEIKNRQITNSFKQYFDAFWKLTKKET